LRLAEFAALLKREQARIERALREHLAARVRLAPAKSKARRRTRAARA